MSGFDQCLVRERRREALEWMFILTDPHLADITLCQLAEWHDDWLNMDTLVTAFAVLQLMEDIDTQEAEADDHFISDERLFVGSMCISSIQAQA